MSAREAHEADLAADVPTSQVRGAIARVRIVLRYFSKSLYLPRAGNSEATHVFKVGAREETPNWLHLGGWPLGLLAGLLRWLFLLLRRLGFLRGWLGVRRRRLGVLLRWFGGFLRGLFGFHRPVGGSRLWLRARLFWRGISVCRLERGGGGPEEDPSRNRSRYDEHPCQHPGPARGGVRILSSCPAA